MTYLAPKTILIVAWVPSKEYEDCRRDEHRSYQDDASRTRPEPIT